MIYLITIFAVLFFLLAWRRLDLAVMLAVAALPAYLIRFNIFGLPSTLLEVMIWAVFLVWLIKNFSRVKSNFLENFKKKKIKIRYPFDWEIALLLFIALAAAGVAGFSSSSLGIWKAYFFEPALFFIVVFNVMNNPPYPPLKGGLRGLELILWPLAISALAVSALAIYQKITGQLIGNPLWAAEGTRRVVSFFGYPNAVGLYLGPIVMVMAGWLTTVIARSSYFLSSSGERQRDPGIQKDDMRNNLDSRLPAQAGLRGNDKIKIVFISLTIILSLLAVYFAKSKGALLGVAAGLIVFGLLAGKKIRLAAIIVLILISAGLAVYKPVRDLAVENITLTNLSGQIRKAGWADSWKMLKDGRFLTGAGLANFQNAVKPYHQAGIFVKDFSDPEAQRKLVFNEAYRTAHWQPLEIYLYPHNIFLNFWSELGLAGLLLFIWIILKYFWLGITPLRGAERQSNLTDNKFIASGLIGAMVAIILHGLVDAPYFKNDLAVMFWLLITLLSYINLKSVN